MSSPPTAVTMSRFLARVDGHVEQPRAPRPAAWRPAPRRRPRGVSCSGPSALATSSSTPSRTRAAAGRARRPPGRPRRPRRPTPGPWTGARSGCGPRLRRAPARRGCRRRSPGRPGRPANTSGARVRQAVGEPGGVVEQRHHRVEVAVGLAPAPPAERWPRSTARPGRSAPRWPTALLGAPAARLGGGDQLRPVASSATGGSGRRQLPASARRDQSSPGRAGVGGHVRGVSTGPLAGAQRRSSDCRDRRRRRRPRASVPPRGPSSSSLRGAPRRGRPGAGRSGAASAAAGRRAPRPAAARRRPPRPAPRPRSAPGAAAAPAGWPSGRGRPCRPGHPVGQVRAAQACRRRRAASWVELSASRMRISPGGLSGVGTSSRCRACGGACPARRAAGAPPGGTRPAGRGRCGGRCAAPRPARARPSALRNRSGNSVSRARRRRGTRRWTGRGRRPRSGRGRPRPAASAATPAPGRCPGTRRQAPRRRRRARAAWLLAAEQGGARCGRSRRSRRPGPGRGRSGPRTGRGSRPAATQSSRPCACPAGAARAVQAALGRAQQQVAQLLGEAAGVERRPQPSGQRPAPSSRRSPCSSRRISSSCSGAGEQPRRLVAGEHGLAAAASA